MAFPAIGSIIYVISRGNIRYEGQLFSVDPTTLSISLRDVRSFGTEGRAVKLKIPPINKIFDCVVFKKADIKEIRVANPPTFPNPAIIEARVAGEKQLMSDFAEKYMNSPLPKAGNPIGYGNNFAMEVLGMNSFGMLNLAMGGSGAGGGGGGGGGGAVGGTVVAGLCDLFCNLQQPFQHPRVNQQGKSMLNVGMGGSAASGGGAAGGTVAAGLCDQCGNQQQPFQQPRVNEQGNDNFGYYHQQRNRHGFLSYKNQRGGCYGGQNRAWPTYRQVGRMPNPGFLPMGGETNIDFSKEFDFEEANSKFEELRSEFRELKLNDEAKTDHQTDGQTEEKVVSENEPGDGEQEPQGKQSKVGYDKSKSFFDNISSDASEDRNARQRRRVNKETFGPHFMGNCRNRRGGHDRYYHK